MAKRKISLQFEFEENLKKDTNFSATKAYAFDDLSDFIEERERIKRLVEQGNQAKLKVDYSSLSNHVFFDSAESKLDVAKSRILNQYPFNGSREEIDSFNLTGSGYESYLLSQWPRDVSYVTFNGTNQYITASDAKGALYPGTSSLYVSVWANPVITNENIVLSRLYKNNNLFHYSERYDNTTYWTPEGAFISSSALPGPFSGTLADVLVEDNTINFRHLLSASNGAKLAVAPSGAYTVSAYVKPVNRNWVRIFCDGSALGSSNVNVYYHLVGNGSVETNTGAGISAGIESLSGSWYRIYTSFIASGTVLNTSFFAADDDNSSTFDGLSQDSLALFGLHLQEDPYQGLSYQYISTSGSVLYYKNGYELFFSGASDPHVKFNLFSGATVSAVSASYTAFTGSFKNVGAVYNDSANLLYLYVNDSLRASSSADLGSIDISPGILAVGSGSKTSNAFFSGNYDLYSGSLNEVRILHTGSLLFHNRNYSRPITAESFVKLHYPFNEGTTGFTNVDAVVVDYSKSALHGKILNYTTSARTSGSVMLNDPGNPILYDFHTRVMSFTSSLALSATLYDLNNRNSIFNHLPEGVLRADDEQSGILRSLVLGMARFFDEIKLYIDQFVNLRVTNYTKYDQSPDLFLPYLTKYFGWKVSEHFDESDPLSFFFGDGILASGTLDVSLMEIRNQFWRRILNNMPLLLKGKGTRTNLNHFLNTLGINKENIIIKEYGYLPGSSIQDTRISKQKVQSRLGIGTGSLSSSFVKASSLIVNGPADFTVEALVQLPYPSASYTGSLLSGAIWQAQSGSDVDGYRAYYVRDALNSEKGKIVFESGSTSFSSSVLQIFDGNFVNLAIGRSPTTNYPFIKIRRLDNDVFDIEQDFTGTVAFSLNTGEYDFVVGSNSGSIYAMNTQGYFGEVRYWTRELSGSEVSDHAYNFQSVGVKDPLKDTSSLLLHWPLNDNIPADSAGVMTGVMDLSRNNNHGTGSEFPASSNSYTKFLHKYNFLSPSVDLKWTENKIRVRNKTELKLSDVATDTNEVSLEFNLVEALNEDIVKLFSTMDTLNEVIGRPVYKYRDEYADLEGIRRNYFIRLGDSLNFSQFFDLFKWFDNKISNAIRQLLPARAQFIGAEQVVESHLLERPKYKHQFPIFKTPQEPPETFLSMSPNISSSWMVSVNAATAMKSEYCAGVQEKEYLAQSNLSGVFISRRDKSVEVDCIKSPDFIDSFRDGDERFDLGNQGFYRIKVSGDDGGSDVSANSGVNYKNESARNTVKNNDRDNN